MKYITIKEYVKLQKVTNYQNTIIAVLHIPDYKLHDFSTLFPKLQGKYFDINCKIV